MRVETVHSADERRHEQRRGSGIDLLRRVHLLEQSRVHHRDPIGDRHRFLLIVGDKDRGDPHAALNDGELRAHMDTQLCVQVGQRLVEQQDARLEYQRPRQGDALLLTSRKLGRITAAQRGQSDQLERRLDTSGDLVARPAAHLQAKRDVVPHGHVRPQRVALEDHRRWPALGRLFENADAVDAHVARVRLEESADHAQRRRLAAAGWSQQTHELAVIHFERQVLHGGLATAAIPLYQVIELEPRHQRPLKPAAR